MNSPNTVLAFEIPPNSILYVSGMLEIVHSINKYAIITQTNDTIEATKHKRRKTRPSATKVMLLVFLEHETR